MSSITKNVLKEVKNRVIGTKLINWREAKWLQNKNLKDLDEEGMEKLKNSLVENDFVMPFNVWEETDKERWILDGHHREKALKELEADGVKVPDTLPATLIRCEDKQEAAKLVLIYSSIYAKITNEGLKDFMEMYELDLEEFKHEIDLPEFSMHRFEQKFQSFDEDEDENEQSEKIEEFSQILVKTGDIFKLGNHLLYCGDGLKVEVWEELLQLLGEEVKVQMVYTDPPYNLPADAIGNLGKKRHKDFAQGGGEMSDEEFMMFLRKIMKVACEISIEGALHFIWMDFRHVWHMTEAGREPYKTLEPKQMCIWNKDIAGMGSFYRAKHELCFIYKFDPTGKAKHVSNVDLKDRIRNNVWEYPGGNSLSNPDREEVKSHPTPKNVAMSREAIMDVTNEGDLVVDFFLGSGTTLIAADQTKRVCAGSEIETHYCQHIIMRYKKHCEKEGKPFEFEHVNGDLTIDILMKTVVQDEPVF
jgi:DNA modification methylase